MGWLRGALGLAAAAACSQAPADDGVRRSREGRLADTDPRWVFESTLAASVRESEDRFGSAVAMEDGVVLVGAPRLGGSGSAHWFRRVGTSYVADGDAAPEAPETNDGFGSAVALSGQLAVVGAPGAGSDTGSAFAFAKSNGTWQLEQELVPMRRAAEDGVGYAVALSGERALVGACQAFGSSAPYYAVVFSRSGTTWSEEGELSSDVPASGLSKFGCAVALSDDRALVGAPYEDTFRGAAYVFARSGTTWSLEQRLDNAAGEEFDEFGTTLAISGSYAAVACITRNESVPSHVHVYSRVGSVWTEQAIISHPDASQAYFGLELSFDQDQMLIGDMTSAFAYELTSGDWVARQELAVGSGLPGLGSTVALAGDELVVGAPADDENRGAVHYYRFGLADGATCTAGAECASGHCVDGNCCDRECTGACAACTVTAGGDVDGVCRIFERGSPGTPACGEQSCDGVELGCVPCAADASCPSNRYCAADSTCRERKGSGATCNVAAGEDCKTDGCLACASGHCVDGVCCGATCAGACEACTQALTGEQDGDCAPIPAGEDPNDECAAPGDDGCGADGTCDGERRCRRYRELGAACGATTCDDGAISGQICDGNGLCGTDSAGCGLYACAGEVCGTSCSNDGDCAPGARCAGERCAPKSELGKPCAQPEACSSGHCVDGVCCNTACRGRCEACAESGTEGTCTAVLGEPRGDRPACPTEDATEPCARTRCDGEIGDRCAGYVGDDVACRAPTCDDGVATLAAECDGHGSCREAQVLRCDPYVCAGDACGAECASSRDCAEQFRCDGSTCVAAETTCSEDGLSVLRSDGSLESCDPLRCAGGSCLPRCRDGADCAPGMRCTAEATCVAVGSPSAAGDGGCGCRLVPISRRSGTWLLVLVLAWTVRRRFATLDGG